MNARQEILDEYQVDENGRITSPGKFEGEPIYAPYFWASLLNGIYDREDDDGVVFFDVTDTDRAEFPELANVEHVQMWDDDQGFVYIVSVLNVKG